MKQLNSVMNTIINLDWLTLRWFLPEFSNHKFKRFGVDFDTFGYPVIQVDLIGDLTMGITSGIDPAFQPSIWPETGVMSATIRTVSPLMLYFLMNSEPKLWASTKRKLINRIKWKPLKVMKFFIPLIMNLSMPRSYLRFIIKLVMITELPNLWCRTILWKWTHLQIVLFVLASTITAI